MADASLDRLMDNTAEFVTKDELIKVIAQKDQPKAYIGFEPSGLAHIGLMVTMNKVTDLLAEGFEVTILLADWHARINDKLGGDMETIRAAGDYLAQCIEALIPRELHGGLRFTTATELISDPDYWEKVIRVAKASSLARVRRALTIMGRSEDEAEADTSMYLYPAMQVADIYELEVDLALGGMDQRKAHMLARDVAEKLGWPKPVALHTPLLGSLSGGGRMEMQESSEGKGPSDAMAKMSKSDPNAALLVHDTDKQFAKKLRKAFCPPERAGNPVLDLWEYVMAPAARKTGGPLVIVRPEKFGGDITYTDYAALEAAYLAGELHPLDLKNGAAAVLGALLQPLRESFEQKPEAYEKLLSTI